MNAGAVRVSWSELDASAGQLDEAVASSTITDTFCSSAAWQLSAWRAFQRSDGDALWSWRDARTWMLFSLRVIDSRRVLLPLEAQWGYACPLLGPSSHDASAALVQLLRSHRTEWDTACITGVLRSERLFSLVTGQLMRRGMMVGIGQTSARCVASLDGGLDGFLSRRSPKFRKNLRRLQRRADGDIVLERHAPATADEADACFARALDVEARSWKGEADQGIVGNRMETFYRHMIGKLVSRGALRVTFACSDDGQDIGYVLGGVFGRRYRGLQISFDDRFDAYSIGHLMQLHTIEGLCAEGIDTYDLGQRMAYKSQWAERVHETVAIIVR